MFTKYVYRTESEQTLERAEHVARLVELVAQRVHARDERIGVVARQAERVEQERELQAHVLHRTLLLLLLLLAALALALARSALRRAPASVQPCRTLTLTVM